MFKYSAGRHPRAMIRIPLTQRTYDERHTKRCRLRKGSTTRSAADRWRDFPSFTPENPATWSDVIHFKELIRWEGTFSIANYCILIIVLVYLNKGYLNLNLGLLCW